MKKEVKVSVVQFAVEWLQPEANRQRMRSFVEAEAREGADLIVFPELANSGYVPLMSTEEGLEGEALERFASEYWQAAEPIPGPTTEMLSEVARAFGVHVVAGIAQRHPVVDGALYNSAVVVGPQGIIGVHHKVHVPAGEKQFFCPGNAFEVFKTELGNIGIAICYDARFPEPPRVLALKGAEIICNPANVPLVSAIVDADNYLLHRGFTRAQENGVYFVSANRVGRQGKMQFLGRSCVAAPNGTILATSKSSEEEVLRAILTEEQLVSSRTMIDFFHDRRPDLYGAICNPLTDSPLLAGTQDQRR